MVLLDLTKAFEMIPHHVTYSTAQVGGIKEKVIAARRSQVRTIVLPSENRKDVDELADSVTEGLDIRYVETYQQVLDIAFPAKSR